MGRGTRVVSGHVRLEEIRRGQKRVPTGLVLPHWLKETELLCSVKKYLLQNNQKKRDKYKVKENYPKFHHLKKKSFYYFGKYTFYFFSIHIHTGPAGRLAHLLELLPQDSGLGQNSGWRSEGTKGPPRSNDKPSPS